MKRRNRRNRSNRAIAFILVMLFLLNTSILPVTAEAETSEIIISSVEDFIKLAKNCKTDSYSKGKTFNLQKDLDLSEVDFTPIPIFTGVFKGNGYTISGIEYEGKSSNQGLFRIISEGAVVENLKVQVKFTPEGDQSYIGGLCAVNRGTINNCTVSGFVSGTSEIGGITGINEKTGEILDSTSLVKVKGKNQTGGIAGTNLGVIKSSNNSGKINIEANEWGTNTGGIAGRNDGSIKNCINDGNVGYPHTGYNTGGITGMLTGYIEGATNRGDIEGRRDVGGIVGQLDISYRVEYTVNYMEELSKDINALTGSLNNLAANVGKNSNNAAIQLKDVINQSQKLVGNLDDSVKGTVDNSKLILEIREDINVIKAELAVIEGILKNLKLDNDNIKVIINDIKEALGKLGNGNIVDSIEVIKELEDLFTQLINELPHLEDIPELSLLKESVDKIEAALNNMIVKAEEGVQEDVDNAKETMDGISKDFEGLINEADELINTLPDVMNQFSADMDKVNEGFSQIGNTINKIAKGPKDITKDLSELIEEAADGSILYSSNNGKISADYNSGGIVGAVQRENILDPESEEYTEVTDYIFADSTVYIKATIYGCSNSGTISTKYDHSGGIVGKGRNGAVIESINTGVVKANRDYAGGIAGDFAGVILRCSASGYIEGENYVGGISGKVKNISESITISQVNGDGAYIGAVAGQVDGEVETNYFIEGELGGIDGINFEGEAIPLTYDEILALNNCPEEFKKLEIKFVADGEVVDVKYVPYGGKIESLPAVEKKGDKYWTWDDFDKENITHSQIIMGEYHNAITVLATKEKVPMFVAEGIFYPGQEIEVEELSIEDINGEFKNVVGLYQIHIAGESEEKIKLHYKADKKVKLYESNNGEWKEIKMKEDGNYLVFELNNGGKVLALSKAEDSNIFSIIGVVLLLAAVSIALFIIKKKK